MSKSTTTPRRRSVMKRSLLALSALSAIVFAIGACGKKEEPKTAAPVSAPAAAPTAPAATGGEAAAKKWIDSEFQPSTLSKDQQTAELKWFIDAAAKLKAKGVTEISVVSETITTHEYESKTLAKAFAEITGITRTPLARRAAARGHLPIQVPEIAPDAYRIIQGDPADLLGIQPLITLRDLYLAEKPRLQKLNADLAVYRQDAQAWADAHPAPVEAPVFWFKPHRNSRYLTLEDKDNQEQAAQERAALTPEGEPHEKAHSPLHSFHSGLRTHGSIDV